MKDLGSLALSVQYVFWRFSACC